MNPSARLYPCARCHRQVMICRQCDRGHVYCFSGCAQQARSESLHRARCRYQSSRRGRIANALRQRRYRQRQRQRDKVTHHGSPPCVPDAVLQLAPETSCEQAHRERDQRPHVVYCHACWCECELFLRRDFLSAIRRHRRGAPSWPYD